MKESLDPEETKLVLVIYIFVRDIAEATYEKIPSKNLSPKQQIEQILPFIETRAEFVTELSFKNLPIQPFEVRSRYFSSDSHKEASKKLKIQTPQLSPTMTTEKIDKSSLLTLIAQDGLTVAVLKKQCTAYGVTIDTADQKDEIKQKLKSHLENLADTGPVPTPAAPTMVTLTSDQFQQLLASRSGDSSTTAKNIGDVFAEMSANLPVNIDSGRFAKLETMIPASANARGKRTTITDISSYGIMYIGVSKFIQSLLNETPPKTKDAILISALFECMAFADLEGRDSIEVARKIWYQTLTTLSSWDIESMTAAKIRSIVRAEFQNQQAEIRSVETFTSRSRSSSHSYSKQNSHQNERSSKRRAPPQHAAKGQKICADFNSAAGCPLSERDCQGRHICSFHFHTRDQTYSNHGEHGCKAKNAQN